MAELSDKPGYSFNPGPPPEVTSFFRNKGLKPSFSWEDVEAEEHAVAFTVAKAMQTDVLTSIQKALNDAMEEGVPYAQFKKDLEPRLRKLGWWGVQEIRDPVTGEMVKAQLGSPRRLKTIYRANMRSARAAGQWDRIERNKSALPYLVYLLGPSEKHRPHHENKAGMVLPVDDVFWRSWYPPNGWNCKCHVRQITRREAERRGISESPRIETREEFVSRTGEYKDIPIGIDAGWEMNPGAYRQANSEAFLRGRLNTVDADLARIAARDMATSWRMRRVLDGSAKGRVPVAMMPDQLKSAIGAKSGVVEFTDEAAAWVRSNHPGVTPEAFARIDNMLQTGTVYRGERGTLIFSQTRADGLWAATIKTDNDGGLILAAYHKAAKEFAEAFLRAENILRPGQ